MRPAVDVPPVVVVRVDVGVRVAEGAVVAVRVGVDAEPVLAMYSVATQPVLPVLVRMLDQLIPSTLRPSPMIVPVESTARVPMMPPEYPGAERKLTKVVTRKVSPIIHWPLPVPVPVGDAVGVRVPGVAVWVGVTLPEVEPPARIYWPATQPTVPSLR